MYRVCARDVGLVFAAALGAGHTLWALLVWAGGGQWVLDVIFRRHMITPAYRVGPFEFTTAVALVVVTAGLGYAFGWVIATLWNGVVVRPERKMMERGASG